MTPSEPISVGVIGVGNMGSHHARVYNELPDASLCGVADDDIDRAQEVAHEYGTVAKRTNALIAEADAVTIAVPTDAHYDLARRCIDAETDILVEKPFVSDQEDGRELDRLASERGLVLQVGHIERFNPAIRALFDLVETDDIVALRADRLGPPVGHSVSDEVVIDLMIHDIDVLIHLLGSMPSRINGAVQSSDYASTLMEFGSDVVATLTASRVTQRKIRQLAVTTPDRHFAVDYLDQSVQIHRRSRPSYLQEAAEMRYRHESIIEQPLIESAEPLKLELESFLAAVRDRSSPVVTAEDGLQALSVVRSIEQRITEPALEPPRP